MKAMAIVLFVVGSLALETFGQDLQSSKLYWVVETNIHRPSYSIVRFYNVENVQVHEVKLMGVFIDIRNPKQRKKLDRLMKAFNERFAMSSERLKPGIQFGCDRRFTKIL